jgi:hypothetical protein
LTEGYIPTTHGRKIAVALEWPSAFAEAIFTSARARGLVEPFPVRGQRGRSRWRLSARGRVWMAVPRRASEIVVFGAGDRPATAPNRHSTDHE